MSRRNIVKIPLSNASYKPLSKGQYSGKGIGSVLLDGGMGGQSSYASPEAYTDATGIDPFTHKRETTKSTKGEGLADKIAHRLSNLNIDKKTGVPKKKNITMSF